MAKTEQNGKSLESWLWDAACSIRGAKEAAKYCRKNALENEGDGFYLID